MFSMLDCFSPMRTGSVVELLSRRTGSQPNGTCARRSCISLGPRSAGVAPTYAEKTNERRTLVNSFISRDMVGFGM